MVEILAGGLLGALLATVVQFWSQRIRLKADIMMAVVRWASETYYRTIDLEIQKKAVYSGGKPWLTEEEYQTNSRELRNRLLYSDVPAQLALIYGEGDELAVLNDLKKELLEASRAMWVARQDTWTEVSRSVHGRFEKVVDPLRSKLEKTLLRRAVLPRLLIKMGL